MKINIENVKSVLLFVYSQGKKPTTTENGTTSVNYLRFRVSPANGQTENRFSSSVFSGFFFYFDGTLDFDT